MTSDLPWKGAADAHIANFALGDLVNNLPRKLTINGGVHAETALAASGAIAGYAARLAVLSRMAPTTENGFVNITAPKGGPFIYGEPIKQALLPQSQTDQDKLWALAVNAALSTGLSPENLPSCWPMFSHVINLLGTDREGRCSLEESQPLLPAKDLLRAVWPLALMCFNGELSGKVLQPPVIDGQRSGPPEVVSQRWRPIIAAIATHRLIRNTAMVLSPIKAVTIVMETAIYASLLPPSAVQVAA